MAAMFGWFNKARTLASRLKRASRSGSRANSSGKLFRQDFDGNVPAELLVLGSEDLAHSASTNGLENFVVG